MRHEHHGPRHGGFGPPRCRTRRGDIRTAVLAVLAERPCHGYEVIQALEERTQGAWRPSPGSIYPTLQLLEDEGLAQSTERDGKKVFELTDAGKAEAAARVEQAGPALWTGHGGGALAGAVKQLAMAARQIGAIGTPEQVERAAAIVNDARKQLYRLLAED